MTADAHPELREQLAQLRLERGDAAARGRRRWPWVIGALVLVALGLAALAGRGRPVAVETATAKTVAAERGGAPAVPVLSGAGYVVSADRYISIGVRVAGRIDRYVVEEGDHVQVGDPLVELDAREYRAAVDRAEANLRLARANRALADAQLRRARPLGQGGIISREELDVKESEARSAAARVGQAEAELEQARVALDYTVLRAPRSGVILAKLKEVGEIAVPGGFDGSGDLIRMANLADLRGQVDVTESELAKIRLDQRAEVVPDALPDRRYAAHVVKLYPQVDRQKGTLRVEVQIEQPDDKLWPDMSARITFLEEVPGTAGPSGAVLAPKSTVHTDGDARFVWVVADGRARRTPVQVGPAFGDDLQVTSGLAGGETLVVGDVAALHDGQAVTTGAAK
ncbi:MAG: efflux RND transporter periplasmic adaptor subunit [bacterium]|nr:efflux RND transporter periplasmic adaptor subunit [bacterium]